MEISLYVEDTGCEEVYMVDENETVDTLSRRAEELFHLQRPAALYHNGEVLASTEPLTFLEQGSRVVVNITDSVRRDIASGKRFSEMPEWVRDDRDCVFAAARKTPASFSLASEGLRHDKPLVLSIMRNSTALFQYLPTELKHDLDVYAKCIKERPYLVTKLNLTTPEEVAPVVAVAPLCLQHLAQHLKDNKDVVLWAISVDPSAVKHASQRLRADKDIVDAVIDRDPHAFKYLSHSVRSDHGFVRRLLSLTNDVSAVVKHVSGALQEDKEFIMEMVRKDGLSLAASKIKVQVGPKKWVADPEVTMTAVRQNGLALQYCADSQKDLQTVLAAVGQNGMAYHHVATALAGRRDVVLCALQTTPAAYRGLSPKVRNGKHSEEFAKKAAELCGDVVQYIPSVLLNDLGFVEWLVTTNGLYLQHASERMKANSHIVCVAVKNAPTALQFASQDIQEDAWVLRMMQAEGNGPDQVCERTPEESSG